MKPGKSTGWYLLIPVCLLLSSFLLGGCEETRTVDLREKIEHEQPGAVASSNRSFQRVLENDTVSVAEFQVRSFYTLARTPRLQKFPCQSCHTGNLQPRGSVPRAHWDKTLRHGQADWMTCQTCHSSEDMNVLRGQEGDTFSFDRSYRLCGQCHFEQLEDWAGGAHGKQQSYWGSPRVIYNCADCHNPHHPAFEQRWPVAYPSIP